MIRNLSGEEWKPFRFDGYKTLRYKYAISSHGRIASYKEDLLKDGKILKGSSTAGYHTFNLHTPEKVLTLYIHREVARYFLPKKTGKKNIVIHLNHNKNDNRCANLKWVTMTESMAHQQGSPEKIAYKQKQKNLKKGHKLTRAQAHTIKKLLADHNRKLTIKQLATRYDVSEMTIYRIKRGENWAEA